MAGSRALLALAILLMSGNMAVASWKLVHEALDGDLDTYASVASSGYGLRIGCDYGGDFVEYSTSASISDADFEGLKSRSPSLRLFLGGQSVTVAVSPIQLTGGGALYSASANVRDVFRALRALTVAGGTIEASILLSHPTESIYHRDFPTEGAADILTKLAPACGWRE